MNNLNKRLRISKTHQHNYYNLKRRCIKDKVIHMKYMMIQLGNIYLCNLYMYNLLQTQNCTDRNLEDMLHKYLSLKNKWIDIEYMYFDQHILDSQKDK